MSPISKKGKGPGLKKKGAKGKYVLKSPKSGKVLAQGSKERLQNALKTLHSSDRKANR